MRAAFPSMIAVSLSAPSIFVNSGPPELVAVIEPQSALQVESQKVTIKVSHKHKPAIRRVSRVSSVRVILLIGIVKKNGIMLVDFALSAERERGLSPREAIYEACLQRLAASLAAGRSNMY